MQTNDEQTPRPPHTSPPKSPAMENLSEPSVQDIEEESVKQEFDEVSTSIEKPTFGRQFSSWVVNHEREQEGYTAGVALTIFAMVCAMVNMALVATGYVLLLTHVRFENGTDIGYGDEVLFNLIEEGAKTFLFSGVEFDISTWCLLATVLAWTAYYVVDVQYFPKVLKGAYIVVSIGLTFVASLFNTENFIAAPYLVYLIISIGIISGTKMYLFKTVQKTFYLVALVIATMLSAAVIVGIFAYSALEEGNRWDIDTKVTYHVLINCEDAPALQALGEVADDVFEATFIDCDAAFILWVSPMMYFAASLLFSGLLLFLYRAEKQRILTKQSVKIEPLAQVFMWFVILAVFSLYIAASIASATTSLATTLLALSLVALVLCSVIFISLFGLDYVSSQFKKTPIGLKAWQIAKSNWVKGLAVLVFTIPAILFLFIDSIKQAVRKCTCLGKPYSEMSEKERASWFTESVQQRLDQFFSWNFGSVLPKSLIWGMGYYLFSVGVARMTIVFLSYLREQLEDSSLLSMTLILIGVGLIMFLLPPVPGVPVYITAGILLPSAAEDEFGGFVVALLFALAISLLMKLCALVLQQKVIGEGFGSKSVAVRRAVGINSVTLRAMRKILQKPGLSYGKVVILIGGPDWPTSVLTGILRLNVFEMMIGTLPVVFLIAPCVVTGAMLVKTAEEPDNSTLSAIYTLAVLFTTLVQGGAMLVATSTIASTAVKYEKELSEEEPDQEVLELDEKSKELEQKYIYVTEWKNVSPFWRTTLKVLSFLMILSSYAFALAGSSLFVEYEITDSISNELSGNALYLVTDIGWAVHVIFGIACMGYFVFRNVHKRKAKSKVSTDILSPVSV